LLENSEQAVTVVPCRGGDDGLRAVRAKSFDCVLLDLRLEGENGLDVQTSLHALRATLPVIVFTGQSSEQAAVEAFVAGAAYYLGSFLIEMVKNSTEDQTQSMSYSRHVGQALA
jgi:DNA-binding response OmpR family regulator